MQAADINVTRRIELDSQTDPRPFRVHAMDCEKVGAFRAASFIVAGSRLKPFSRQNLLLPLLTTFARFTQEKRENIPLPACHRGVAPGTAANRKNILLTLSPRLTYRERGGLGAAFPED